MPDVYILVDALTDDTLRVEAAYSLGPGSTYGPPVLMHSPASDGATQFNGIQGATKGVFPYGGAVYAILRTEQAAVHQMQIAKSLDRGATWTTLDSSSAPVAGSGSGYFDGAHTVYFAFGGGSGSSVAMKIQSFDLSTGLWGAASAAGPASFITRTIWKRTDGTLLVLFQNRNSRPGDGSSGLAGVAYDPSGGTWGSSFDVGAAILLLTGWNATHTILNGPISSYMDAAGRVGVFFHTSSNTASTPIWDNRCFYQQIHLDDSLGTFFDFPGQVAPLGVRLGTPQQALQAFSGSPLGTPILLPAQDKIVLPVLMENFSLADPNPPQVARAYIGTPISAPVWSVDTSKTIDPGVIADDKIWPQGWGSTFFDGTTIYVVTSGQGDDLANFSWIRLLKTTNLASPADGWTGVTAAKLTDMPLAFRFSGQEFITPTVSVVAGGVIYRNTFE